jgi:hypothetical protein
MPKRSPARTSYFKNNTGLEEPHQKYCRCVLHVASKNPIEINLSKKYGPGTGFANPYSVCSKTTHRRGSVACGAVYDFTSIPYEEVKAFAALHGIDPSQYKTRRGLVNALNKKQGNESAAYKPSPKSSPKKKASLRKK